MKTAIRYRSVIRIGVLVTVAAVAVAAWFGVRSSLIGFELQEIVVDAAVIPTYRLGEGQDVIVLTSSGIASTTANEIARGLAQHFRVVVCKYARNNTGDDASVQQQMDRLMDVLSGSLVGARVPFLFADAGAAGAALHYVVEHPSSIGRVVILDSNGQMGPANAAAAPSSRVDAPSITVVSSRGSDLSSSRTVAGTTGRKIRFVLFDAFSVFDIVRRGRHLLLHVAAAFDSVPGSLATGEVLIDNVGNAGSGPRMKVLPGGSFAMGDFRQIWKFDQIPVHRVDLLQPIAAAVTEVTVSQFRQFIEDSGQVVEAGCWHHDSDQVWRFYAERTWFAPGYAQTEQHPVACVSWYDAQAYLRWLSDKTGQRYRLPTEAELEFLVRAGSKSQYGFAPAENAEICTYANGADTTIGLPYANEACSDGYVWTAPVGTFKPNPFGLHDTHGNLWEWAEDCWRDGSSRWLILFAAAPAKGRPWERENCRYRSMRGGSWLSSPDSLRVSARRPSAPIFRLTSVGFRPVRELGSETQ